MDRGDRVDAAPLQVVVPSQAVVPSKATMTLAVTLVVWSRAPPAIPVMSEGVRRCSAQKLNTSSSDIQNVKTRNTGAAGHNTRG